MKYRRFFSDYTNKKIISRKELSTAVTKSYLINNAQRKYNEKCGISFLFVVVLLPLLKSGSNNKSTMKYVASITTHKMEQGGKKR